MTAIQWTDKVWNPVVGCTRVSAGCEHCYAERVAHRGMQEAHRGLTVASGKGPRWNGTIRCLPERLEQPLRWRKPLKVFVNSMSDLFHETVPDEFIDRVFGVMALSQYVGRCRSRKCDHESGCASFDPPTQHTFQVLTKRPARMRDYIAKDRRDTIAEAAFETWSFSDDALDRMDWPLPNIWLGVSVENQKAADERIPLLLEMPAAVRFVSAEPLLAPVNLSRWLKTGWESWMEGHPESPDPRRPGGYGRPLYPRIDWVIVGGESGPGSRPCHTEWIRDVVRQCDAAGVPMFVKQDSGQRPGKQGRIPDDLWIQEWPDAVQGP